MYFLSSSASPIVAQTTMPGCACQCHLTIESKLRSALGNQPDEKLSCHGHPETTL
jgi:hypothetical protein